MQSVNGFVSTDFVLSICLGRNERGPRLLVERGDGGRLHVLLPRLGELRGPPLHVVHKVSVRHFFVALP